MVLFSRAQAWALVAAVAFSSQAFVMLIDNLGWIQVAALGVVALVGAFLLRGSRVAWSIAVIGAAGQLVEAIFASQPIWVGILNAAVLICLFVPPSIRFVWEKSPDRSRRTRLGKTQQKVHELFYRFLAVAAGWENSLKEEGQQRPSRSYRTLIWRLGTSTVLLL